MADTISGTVTRVIDGDTFEMTVAHQASENEGSYERQEKIRIANVDAPELSAPGGSRSKQQLELILGGKDVRCYVQTRDTYGRLVAVVELV